MNNFKRQLDLSKHPKIQADFDSFYRKIYGSEIIIKRYDKSTEAQRDYGVDTIIILSNGIRISIDEKLRSAKYANQNPFYVIELMSNCELKKAGWLFTNIYQYICYGNCNKKNDGLISFFMFPCDFHFKTFILNNKEKFRICRANTDDLYHTEFALVHWHDIQRAAGRNNCHQFGLERYEDGIS